MDKEAYSEFLGTWEQAMWILFGASVVLSILTMIIYWIRYSSKSSLKEKFDLASEKETKVLRNAQFILAAGVFFVVNAQQTETVQLNWVWFFIRVFMGLCIGTLHGYVAHLIFEYYYPGKLSGRLERLRYTPRINPKTGNKMKLLSEEEEDAYLDEGMQAEEDVFSVDYDVWIDEASGDTQIEKYKGHLTAHECDRCGFQTLRLVKEEVTQEATEFWDGELQQEFNCSYCGRIKRKTVKLSRTVNEDPSKGKLVSDPLAGDREIEVVKVEIHSNKGEIKKYDFQNLDQAKQFMEEFDFDKVE